MDADFSHSPEVIPNMIHELQNSDTDVVVASRYIEGGSIVGWPFKRRLISRTAIKIAQISLGIQKQVTDPMSGFFAFKRHIMENISINTAGYKILLEILVKTKDRIKVKEIPYTFTDRRAGESKLGSSVIIDYVKAVGELYRYQQQEKRGTEKKHIAIQKQIKKHESLSLLFSQAGKFAAVGISGMFINYLVSFLLSYGVMSSVWYVKATFIGIIISNASNFILNKLWTFEDRNFSIRPTLKQYGLYLLITSFGIGIQLGLVYTFVQSALLKYEFALILSILIASISNFLLNKKWTFR
jgi:dolichol-phosphate mannosyltransferase